MSLQISNIIAASYVIKFEVDPDGDRMIQVGFYERVHIANHSSADSRSVDLGRMICGVQHNIASCAIGVVPNVYVLITDQSGIIPSLESVIEKEGIATGQMAQCVLTQIIDSLTSSKGYRAWLN